jgi:hypothetical protein
MGLKRLGGVTMIHEVAAFLRQANCEDMSVQEDIVSRRRFLKLAAGTAAAAVLVGGLPRIARADGLPHLSESDPTAKALGYVEDGATATDPRHKNKEATCANCQFYSGGATGYGPCQLFPGKSVSAKGWCISHASKSA